MKLDSDIQIIKRENTINIGAYLHQFGIALFGIANLDKYKEQSNLIPPTTIKIIKNYKYAIVFGAELLKSGEKISGTDRSLFLEEVAFKLMLHLIEKEKHSALIIHTEDEFDPMNRSGLLPLKALAKSAGLGWQGRSLLIISPEYGPLHRLIAILTDMPLLVNNPMVNQCGDCQLCVEKCPANALKKSLFTDHPNRREDVLDIMRCKGDDGCLICIKVCPWTNN